MKENWDIIVIGAGPAGCISARALAKKGMQVLLIDKASFPRDKVCGCCLSQRALKSLADAGLEDFIRDVPAVRLTEFHLGSGKKAVCLPLPEGRAISRAVLDAGLAAEAERAGAKFLPATKGRLGTVEAKYRQVHLEQGNKQETVLAKAVLICDGIGGISADPKGEDLEIDTQSRWGACSAFADENNFYRPGTIYMAVGPRAYVGAVRLAGGRVNFAAAFEHTKENFKDLIVETLDFAGFSIPNALASAVWKGTPPLTRERRVKAGERFFILGDAAGYSEPFTGEGMAWAVDSALALSSFLEHVSDFWDNRLISLWEKWHRTHVRPRQIMSRLLTKSLRHPWLLRQALSLLAGHGELARPLVRFVCGAGN